MSIPAYWLAAFLWDNVSYQLTVWLIVILIAGFPNTDALSGRNAIGPTIALLILFGTAVSGFTYCLSFFFTSPPAAQIFTIFLVFILGVVLSQLGSVMRLVNLCSPVCTQALYMDYLRYIFALFPPFCLGEGLNTLALLQTFSAQELVPPAQYSALDWKITGYARSKTLIAPTFSLLT